MDTLHDLPTKVRITSRQNHQILHSLGSSAAFIASIWFVIVLSAFIAIADAHSQESSQPVVSSFKETPIFPTWQLMDDAAKRQFLAGYIYGFREARSLGEVALSYASNNPPDLISGLGKLLQHYQLTDLTPNNLVPLLNKHFSDPKNQQDSLRFAINRLIVQPHGVDSVQKIR